MELPDLTPGGYKVLATLSLIGAIFFAVVISTPFHIFGTFDCPTSNNLIFNDGATMKILPIEGWCCAFGDPTETENEACIEWSDFGSTYTASGSNMDFVNCYTTAGCVNTEGFSITYNTPGNPNSGIAELTVDSEIGERWSTYASLTSTCLAFSIAISIIAVLCVFIESIQKIGQWLYFLGCILIIILTAAAIGTGQQEDSALTCQTGDILEICSGRFSSTYTSAIFCYIAIAQFLWCVVLAYQAPKQCKCCCIDVSMRKEPRLSMNPNADSNM